MGVTVTEGPLKWLMISVYVTIYMAVGPSLILVNKYILRDLGFSYPFFISGLGLFVTGSVAHIIVRLGYVKLVNEDTVTLNFWVTKIVPAGAGTALSHTLGNGAMMYLTVAFVQMLKSFTPAIVMIMLAAFKIDIPTNEVVLSVLVLCFGTALASFGEMNMNWIGFFMMVGAALSESTRLVLTQFLLKNLKFSAIEGQYYLAPASAVCLFAGSLVLEAPRMVSNGHLQIIADNVPTFLLAGFLGLAINHASFLVIQATSGVTIKVLGMVRNAFLVLFTVFVQGEVVTSTQFFGYAITLVGFAFYNYFKMTQGKNKGGGAAGKNGAEVASPSASDVVSKMLDLDSLQAEQSKSARQKQAAKEAAMSPGTIKPQI